MEEREEGKVDEWIKKGNSKIGIHGTKSNWYKTKRGDKLWFFFHLVVMLHCSWKTRK